PTGFQVDGGVLRATEAGHVRAAATLVFDRAGFELIATQAPADLLMTRFGTQGSDDGSTLEALQRSLRSPAFATELDRLRESVREDLDLDQAVSISVASVSLGLSLVYVLWLIRGGVLVASYLSALPAWRILDPLPVLSRVEDEEEGEEDEPLQADGNEARNTLRGFG
ncbi:MAG TPA: hypothetical protein VNB23_06355, partial [Ramlibacter sp.]|nr:hypothetical protein [Ramlibacter sp.]